MTLSGSVPHRHSIRLTGYDYSQAGAYFVTICTYHRQLLFGEIHDGEMHLNASGRMVSAQWLQLPYRYIDLELGEFVVMPNHIHGILVITGRGEASLTSVFAGTDISSEDASLLRPNGTVPGSIGAIIQNFKSITSRKINKLSGKSEEPIWQRNYYEHVIRDEIDYQAIHDYILSNPLNREKDEKNQKQTL